MAGKNKGQFNSVPGYEMAISGDCKCIWLGQSERGQRYVSWRGSQFKWSAWLSSVNCHSKSWPLRKKKGRFCYWGYFIFLISFMTVLQNKCLRFYYFELQYIFQPMFVCCLYAYSLPLALSIFRNSCLHKFQHLPLWKMEPLLEQNMAAV